MSDFVCGANEEGFHLTGVNFGPRPAGAARSRTSATSSRATPSPDGKGRLEIVRGIEVGHIFQLRTKYSEAMKATFLDEKGKPQPMEMGCYGIGVTRIVAAAIEQNHDERGIVFPAPIAPFEVCIVPIGYRKSAAVRAAADKLLRRARRRRRRRAARRPRRAPRRAVRRHGPDRHPAPRGARRARPGRAATPSTRDAATTSRRTCRSRGVVALPEGAARRSDEARCSRACSCSLCCRCGARRQPDLRAARRQRARSACSRRSSDRAAPTLHFRSAEDGNRWLAEMDERLESASPTASSASSCCARCTTRRCAPGSTRSWCWA